MHRAFSVTIFAFSETDVSYDEVMDLTDGIEWSRWFTGGAINMSEVCVDRWAAAAPERPAAVVEDEDGYVTEVSYGLLLASYPRAPSSPTLPMHDVVEGPAIWLGDGRERADRRPTESDQVGAPMPLGEAQQRPGEILIRHAAVAGGDTQIGGCDHHVRGRLAEVVGVRHGPLVALGLAGDERDRNRTLCDGASSGPHFRELLTG